MHMHGSGVAHIFCKRNPDGLNRTEAQHSAIILLPCEPVYFLTAQVRSLSIKQMEPDSHRPQAVQGKESGESSSGTQEQGRCWSEILHRNVITIVYNCLQSDNDRIAVM